jgi:ABC-type multidrug transport system fused ATPase/permease subunit
MITMLQRSFVSVERIVDYVKAIDEEPSWDVGAVTPPRDWPSKGEILLHNVSMRYRPKLPLACKCVSASLAGASSYGITGRTGSGKSTLMLLLFRMYDLASGIITIDNIDISKVALHTLRKRFGMIPQVRFFR